MKLVQGAVGIGVGSGSDLETPIDILVTYDNRLVIDVRDTSINTHISLGKATVGRIDFIIECLQRLRIHASDHESKGKT